MIPLAVLFVLLLVPARQTRAADIFVGDAAGLQGAVASATAGDLIILTVSNMSSVPGENVVITDTLIPELRFVRVEAATGTVNVSEQTVSVTFAALAPGETVQFSIFTDVISGGEVDNEACLTADNFGGGERCTSALTVATLPDTGETPWWAAWLAVALASLVVMVTSTSLLLWRQAQKSQ